MIPLVEKKSRWINVCQAYFGLPELMPKCDVLRVVQIPIQMDEPGWRCVPFFTLLLDLRKSEEILLEEMGSGTRQKVRRAIERDNLRIEHTPGTAERDLAAFTEFYDAAMRKKGQPKADVELLRILAHAGLLMLSNVTEPNGTTLAWHAHLVASGRARLLHSAVNSGIGEKGSNAAIGRANRLLHWRDICEFKRRGMQDYDFGGISLAKEGDARHGIDMFKFGFGGRIVKEFKCVKGLTLRGRLFVWHRQLREIFNHVPTGDGNPAVTQRRNGHEEPQI